MDSERLNAEGYADPTAYGALRKMNKKERKFRPIVYICSPYSGDVVKNTEAARRYSRFAVEEGCIPLAPHLLFPQFLDDEDPRERELGLFFGKVLMSRCSEVWVFGDIITPGMESEINYARRKGYRLRHIKKGG